MKNRTTIQLKIPSRLGFEKVAASTVGSIADLIGVEKDRIEDLKKGVSEACIHAIERSSRTNEKLAVCILLPDKRNASGTGKIIENDGTDDQQNKPDIGKCIDGKENSRGRGSFLIQILGEDERMEVPDHSVLLTIHLDNENAQPNRFVRVQLLGHDEYATTAALIEERIRNMRQVYAIACIAHGDSSYLAKLPKGGLAIKSDFETYLPPEDRLLINEAGQGSFWATVGVSIVASAKTAPKAAIVALSSMFNGGPERIARSGEAIVKEREGIAAESVAKGRLAEAQAEQAQTREALTTEKQRVELQKQKWDAYFDIRSKIDAIPDPAEKSALFAALDYNVQNLLGESAQDFSVSHLHRPDSGGEL